MRSGFPIINHNIPPRSVIDMSVDTMKRLFELKNIAGVKGRHRQQWCGCRSSARRWARTSIKMSGEDATIIG